MMPSTSHRSAISKTAIFSQKNIISPAPRFKKAYMCLNWKGTVHLFVSLGFLKNLCKNGAKSVNFVSEPESMTYGLLSKMTIL
uniref:Uncharacterized protein n=1 Tax=Heterorhabditis bacteriophora TaxID=37862 RepID=A0A1I7WCE2_HETBA